MRCVLHIGTEKTGTTLLQDWLYDNKIVLSKFGSYLSENLGRTNNRYIPAFFQNHLDDFFREKRISSQVEKDVFFTDFLDRLSKEIHDASNSHDTFIITSEHLHSRMQEKEAIINLHKFLSCNFSDVKVVCYFRNQFDVAVSLYSTALKVSSAAKLAAFLEQASPENYYYNYLSIADNWSEVFGADNCVFKIYDRRRFLDSDLRKDFIVAAECNVNLKKLDYSRSSSNESLSALQAAAYRAINASVPYWLPNNLGVDAANTHLKKKIQSLGELRVGEIQSSERGEIEERFASSNEKFFSKYFNSENKFISSFSSLSPNKISFEKCESAIEESISSVLKLGRPSLNDFEIDALRDIAIKIEAGENLNLNDALVLMEMALKNRPNGPFIKEKVRLWASQLSRQDND